MRALREGFTTGSCAAAAALACCLWQREGECPKRVEIAVPGGRTYAPEIAAHAGGLCGVIKDSGDDPDITDGLEIIARVEPLSEEGEIVFLPGEGVGVVTLPGLKIPPGQPAINPVPRAMIARAVRSVYGALGAKVTISIPGGREIARRTFNPRLGIEGGLSVLGTSGIVRPMSEEALRDSLYEELKMRAAQGKKSLIFTFGNQGEAALARLYPGECVVQVSNELGFMLDAAEALGVSRLLIGGHPGKLCKVAAGVMQTHSQYADARREAIITQLALMGADSALIQRVYACPTTDAAMALIHEAGFDPVWAALARAARRYCTLRTHGQIEIHILFTDAAGHPLNEILEESP